jgi:hypothetical protein
MDDYDSLDSPFFFLDLASTNVGGFRRILGRASSHFQSLSLDSCFFPFLARFLILGSNVPGICRPRHSEHTVLSSISTPISISW